MRRLRPACSASLELAQGGRATRAATVPRTDLRAYGLYLTTSLAARVWQNTSITAPACRCFCGCRRTEPPLYLHSAACRRVAFSWTRARRMTLRRTYLWRARWKRLRRRTTLRISCADLVRFTAPFRLHLPDSTLRGADVRTRLYCVHFVPSFFCSGRRDGDVGMA